MKGTAVVFEGLDITGKTTIAQTISQIKGWTYYKTPPARYYKDCVKLDANGFPVFSEERFRLFLECLRYSSLEIADMVSDGISVTIDRWLWTTLSYHFAFNSGLEALWLKIGAEERATLLQPDLSFLVTIADGGEYERRKSSRRSMTPHDMAVINDKDRSQAILHNFRRLNPSFVHIDNSGKLETTLETVWRNICAINRSD